MRSSARPCPAIWPRSARHGQPLKNNSSRYCGRKFKRLRRSTRLNRHKDGYGNDRYSRSGYIVDQEYV
jgi:hypothetical protein